MVGWIKLHRKTINSAIFDNPHLLKMWIWCLLKATHDEYEQMVGLEKVTLKQGQFITGRNKGSAELSVKPSTWYKHIKTLEKMQMVELISNNKKTIVTVVNWALYQGKENNCSNKVTTKEQQSSNKVTTKEQQSNTNKNGKNIKNGKNNRKDVSEKKKNVPDKEDLMEQYSFLCKDGSTYVLSGEVYRTFKELYPNVNIDEELNRMKGWIYANVNKRKTKSGMKAFINSWLSKEPREYNANKPKSTLASETKYEPFKPANIKIDWGEAPTK